MAKILRLCLVWCVFVASGGCAGGDANLAILDEGGSLRRAWRADLGDLRGVVGQANGFLRHIKDEVASEYQRRACETILGQWDDYACQVICYTRDGRRRIHLNFFPRRRGGEFDWRRRYVDVRDGGFWYWRVEFDWADSRFVDFQVNGSA